MYCKIIAMKKIISVLFIVLFSGAMFAQSADVITEILNSEHATIGQAAYICAVEQNLVQDYSTYDDAVDALISAGFLKENDSSSDLLTYGKTAYLFAKEWSVQGGVMYSLTNGSQRYAFKQLVADGVIPAETDPASLMSGTDFLSLYSVCLEQYSDFDIKSVSMEAE